MAHEQRKKERIEMGKILLTTLFSGYNFGSSLQAFATKAFIGQMGHDCVLVARKSVIRGRDIRLGKLMTILWRTLTTADTRTLHAYRSAYSKTLSGDSAERFAAFERDCLQPMRLSWEGLRKLASECVVCIAGSDQLWNPTSLYVDPLYYLRFAPKTKRIAFATSMGHNFVAQYNRKKLKQWIAEVSHIAVREDSGVRLIAELCGRDDVVQLPDPTMLLDGDTWRKLLSPGTDGGRYILAYFLDSPSEYARKCIRLLQEEQDCEVIAIPYTHEDMSYATRIVSAGPVDFLRLVDNAVTVVTDSFHGTAFSINMHTPFYVFDRNYGRAYSQGRRITSLLAMLGLADRHEPQMETVSCCEMNFHNADIILHRQRLEARRWLAAAIDECVKACGTSSCSI